MANNKKEYEIIDLESGKQGIIYYVNGEEETREHYANKDGVIEVDIRPGYTLKEK